MVSVGGFSKCVVVYVFMDEQPLSLMWWVVATGWCGDSVVILVDG